MTKLPVALSIGAVCLLFFLSALYLGPSSGQEIDPLTQPEDIEKTITVAAGDTLVELFNASGVRREDAYAAVAAMEPLYSSRKIRPGMLLKVTLASAEGQAGSDNKAGGRLEGQEAAAALKSMSFQPSKDYTIKVAAVEKEEGKRVFDAEAIKRPLVRREVYSDFGITSSLYEAAENGGLQPSMVAKLIRIYSYDVDFQREIQKGDHCETVFEAYYDEDGDFVKTGDILYSRLTLSGTGLPLFLFENEDGFRDYYDDRGQTAKKALMRTPIDGARLSSGYGLRKHPILGFNKMHKGVDFAASKGTPIYAAGDGVIERAKRYGSYGNYIRIRHNGEYKTAYAHLNGFAKGIRANKRVRQGQIIGYVGSTGASTGPHLHYEVIKNGQKVNPMSVKIPAGEKLKKQDFASFKKRKDELTYLRQRLVQAKRAANRLVLNAAE